MLSRKCNESIDIGDGIISITVVAIRGDKVRLGIDAPTEINVHRREVLEAIRRGESREAREQRKQAAMKAISSIMDRAG